MVVVTGGDLVVAVTVVGWAAVVVLGNWRAAKMGARDWVVVVMGGG